MHRNRKLIIAFIIILIIILLRFSPIVDWINLEQLKENRNYLQQLISQHYALSVLCYISLYIFSVAFSIPISAVLTMAGGFLFGVLASILYTNIGATLGATISFLLVRYLVGKTIQQKYRSQLTQFNKIIKKYGKNYLLVMRFVMIIPFFLVNILAGLTDIPLLTFAWTTMLGIIPGSLIFALAGQQLHTIESVHDVFSFKILFIVVLLVALALLPIVMHYFQPKRKKI